MALSAFADESSAPRAIELTEVLGRTSALWDKLRDHLASEYQPLGEKWYYSGQRWGWSLQLKQKKRTILYMTPMNGHFLAGFALGARAVRAAYESDSPDSLLSIIDSATKYAEGKAVRIEVRTKNDLDNTEKLAAIKMSN
jgi:hypothetical protein